MYSSTPEYSGFRKQVVAVTPDVKKQQMLYRRLSPNIATHRILPVYKIKWELLLPIDYIRTGRSWNDRSNRKS